MTINPVRGDKVIDDFFDSLGEIEDKYKKAKTSAIKKDTEKLIDLVEKTSNYSVENSDTTYWISFRKHLYSFKFKTTGLEGVTKKISEEKFKGFDSTKRNEAYDIFYENHDNFTADDFIAYQDFDPNRQYIAGFKIGFSKRMNKYIKEKKLKYNPRTDKYVKKSIRSRKTWKRKSN